MLKFQTTLDEIQNQIAKNPSAIAVRHGKKFIPDPNYIAQQNNIRFIVMTDRIIMK